MAPLLNSLRAFFSGGGDHDAAHVTCIRSQTAVTGTLDANGDSVLVEGLQRGDIINAGAVFVNETGRVFGNVSADEVIVAGHVEGEIRAANRVEVHATGLVQGEVSAASCLWLEGGRVIGMVRVGQPGDLTTSHGDHRRPLSPAAEATRRVARTG